MNGQSPFTAYCFEVSAPNYHLANTLVVQKDLLVYWFNGSAFCFVLRLSWVWKVPQFLIAGGVPFYPLLSKPTRRKQQLWTLCANALVPPKVSNGCGRAKASSDSNTQVSDTVMRNVEDTNPPKKTKNSVTEWGLIWAKSTLGIASPQVPFLIAFSCVLEVFLAAFLVVFQRWAHPHPPLPFTVAAGLS